MHKRIIGSDNNTYANYERTKIGHALRSVVGRGMFFLVSFV